VPHAAGAGGRMILTPAERVAMLRDAGDLVGRVLASLNTRAAACPSCGLQRHEDWGEAQVAKELFTMRARLERLAATLAERGG
jgi:hypothetical protein